MITTLHSWTQNFVLHITNVQLKINVTTKFKTQGKPVKGGMNVLGADSRRIRVGNTKNLVAGTKSQALVPDS